MPRLVSAGCIPASTFAVRILLGFASSRAAKPHAAAVQLCICPDFKLHCLRLLPSLLDASDVSALCQGRAGCQGKRKLQSQKIQLV